MVDPDVSGYAFSGDPERHVHAVMGARFPRPAHERRDMYTITYLVGGLHCLRLDGAIIFTGLRWRCEERLAQIEEARRNNDRGALGRAFA